MSDKIGLFQNHRNWNQIKAQVFDLVDRDHQQGLAQNSALVKKLEHRLAEMFGRKHCVTMANCTDALVIAVQCLGLTKPSQIAVSNYTFTATAHAVSRAGHKVVPVDVDNNYCIDPNVGDVSAVVAVDMFGNMCDWSKLEKLSVPIINDAAQSLESHNGHKYSAGYGVISCLSFSPSKTVSSWGSGGALLTDDDDMAVMARRLRLHGKDNNNSQAIDPGLNSMLSAFEAACIWIGLDYSETWQSRRDQISRYLIASSKLKCATDLELHKHTHHKLVFQHEQKQVFMKKFIDNNIEVAQHYNLLINDEYLYREDLDLPVSERLKQTSFTVPNQHTLTDEEVERIVKVLA